MAMSDAEFRKALLKLREKRILAGNPEDVADLEIQIGTMLAGRPTMATRAGLEHRLTETLGPRPDEPDAF